MAEQQQQQQQLTWTRLPDGRFAITVGVPMMIQTPQGPQPQVMPLHTWILSKEEEAKLKASMAGLFVASGNGAH